MPTLSDLRDALDESVSLTGDVISDTNILLNIILPIQTVTGAVRLYHAQQSLLFDYLNSTERALVVASKLSIVGRPLNVIRFAGKRFNDTLENVDSTLSVVDTPIQLIDTGLSVVSAPIATANVLANAALAVNSARIDVLDRLDTFGLVDGGSELTNETLDNYEQLVDANAAAAVGATAPLRRYHKVENAAVVPLISCFTRRMVRIATRATGPAPMT